MSLPLALLLIISLAPILSSATSDCPGFHSVADLLRNNSLPAGLFPADVTGFECSPIRETNKLKLTIHIPCIRSWAYLGQPCCRVTTTNFSAEYEHTITATIFKDNLAELKGVKAKFSDVEESVPVTDVQGFFDLAFQLDTPAKFSDPVYFFKDYEIPPICHPNYFYGRPLLVAA